MQIAGINEITLTQSLPCACCTAFLWSWCTRARGATLLGWMSPTLFPLSQPPSLSYLGWGWNAHPFAEAVQRQQVGMTRC